MNVGVIGFGYWGPNLVRNFSASPQTNVKTVSDMNTAQLKRCSRTYPAVHVTTDYKEIVNDNDIDIVVIATPVATHYKLALEALTAGKHVWVEKPFTATPEEAEHLIEVADKKGLTIIVDHTFIYTGAIIKTKELIDSGELGDIYYYDSTRINLGLFQSDVDVMWDLAVHDMAILHHLFQKKPIRVSATGRAHMPGHPVNSAWLSIMYEDDFIAHINANWLSPVKMRNVLIGGSKKMLLYNDLESSEKLKIYDAGVKMNMDREEVYQALIGYRTGDMLSPKVAQTEALALAVEHFVDCIENKTSPQTNAAMGLEAVKLLTAATESVTNNGIPVEVK